MFQFYDSPIKSRNREANQIRLTSFNSMIVRLKVRIFNQTTHYYAVSIL